MLHPGSTWMCLAMDTANKLEELRGWHLMGWNRGYFPLFLSFFEG